MTFISYSHSEDVATITLLRDEKRNAINQEMAEAILEALQRAEDDRARVVVLRAKAGAKVWCAGHDLSELESADSLAENPTLKIADQIRSLPLPIIALVEGGVYGGGLILLLYADIVVATHNSRVAITSNKLGIPLDPELYAFWIRVMGLHKAKELLVTAQPITAEDALHAGLFNHLVDPDQLEPTVHQLASKICACSAESVAQTKLLLNEIASESTLPGDVLAKSRARNAEIFQSAETRSRIQALLDSIQESN
ncbi:MAG: enoyl-CoA hydratase/isomerase family protein [Planctomycetaceae bacterium]|nr:enoyl-CoA hydratase/isomerase family protein [Planctomycetaceae bacterium]